MARKSAGTVTPGQEQLPVQPVDRPILCNPYEEPRDHWIYDKETGAASRAGTRRPASYWYKTERTGSAQLTLTGLAEEERDDLPLVNALREDVRKWREAEYPGATIVTRDLLRQILHDEENAVDFLEIQLGLIEQMGLQNYIQSLAGEVAEGGH